MTITPTADFLQNKASVFENAFGIMILANRRYTAGLFTFLLRVSNE